jgi:hypothetical protein
VLVLRWFLDDTRLAQLAADNRIGSSTAYRYLHEGIDVLADRTCTRLLCAELGCTNADGHAPERSNGGVNPRFGTCRVGARGRRGQ